jgi:hypothetical protein
MMGLFQVEISNYVIIKQCLLSVYSFVELDYSGIFILLTAAYPTCKLTAAHLVKTWGILQESRSFITMLASPILIQFSPVQIQTLYFSLDSL